jgi:conjugative relaxase-like TrwC/TraI family protein
MLTVKNVVARQARDYYERGYHGGGRWYGRGALYLGLPERIANRAVYCNLLEGYSPDRSRPLTGRRIDPTKHRAALDCTFNAPKSVSLLALAAGDARLINAHRRAVRRTLDRLEEHHAVARAIGRDGIRRALNTDNLTIARFDHIETRDLDPHLHTHCVVMNFTRLPDGRWRGLHNDDIYRHRKEIGMFYQRELALEVLKLGYEVMPREHGQFDIAGFAEKDLESFSKRRQAILALAGESATAAEREAARVATRVGKRTVEQGELKLRWREEAAGLGIRFTVPGRPTVIKDVPSPIFVTPIVIGLETSAPELEIASSSETELETSAPEPRTSLVPALKIDGKFPLDGDEPSVESPPLAIAPVTPPIDLIPDSFPLTVSAEDGKEVENPWREGGGSNLDGDEADGDELFGKAIDRDGFFEDLEEGEDLEEEDDIEL